MAKPKKPSAPNLRTVPAPPESGEFRLTPQEIRLIQAFRKADDFVQAWTLRNTEMFARDPEHMRPTEKQGLRLVAGGAA